MVLLEIFGLFGFVLRLMVHADIVLIFGNNVSCFVWVGADVLVGTSPGPLVERTRLPVLACTCIPVLIMEYALLAYSGPMIDIDIWQNQC